MVEQRALSLSELENLTEAELETLIIDQKSDDARYILGRLLMEGSSEKIKKNEKKGVNWIKEAIKNGHMLALEYKTYHEIRFDNQPKLNKILKNLETIVDKTKSTRACNTLAEFFQVQDKKEDHKENAAKYYNISADQGCQLGIHWMGVFYHLAFGVPKNVERAIEYLSKSARAGNGQSCHQLFLIYSDEKEGFANVKKAYYYLEKGILNGVSLFDSLHAFFKLYQDELTADFLQNKKPAAQVNKDDKNEVLNLHEAYVNEMKNSFSNALSRDRLYMRPVGFLMEQQIWMVGVLSKYFVGQVLRFNHQDFIRALKQDLSPILGEMGLWILTNYANRQREKNKTEKRKMVQVAIEIVKKYLENGFDYLGQEGKYNLMNKYGPKKCPAQQIKRENLQFIYSWLHYAPQSWYKHQIKLEEEQKADEEKRKNPDAFKKCTFCQAPESNLRKHKMCSACKQAFYCSADCQKYDWQKTHKLQCKELQKNMPKTK